MKFDITPVNSDPILRFEVSIQYMHGTTDYTVRHKLTIIESGNFDDLSKYISTFNELKEMIEAKRSGDVDYPEYYKECFEDFYSTFDVEGLDNVSIELINDETIDEFDCFARIEIADIFFYNEKGEKFKVKIIE